MKNTRTGFVAAAVLALVASYGCAVDDVDELGPDEDFRIINGDPAPSNVPEYAATIALHQRFGESVSTAPFCSGTLIDDDVVLTAAHCCDEAGFFSPNFNPMEPEDLIVFFGEGPAYDGSNWEPGSYFQIVSEVLIHPSYNRNQLLNDICLLRLSTPNTEVTPIPHLPAALGLNNGDVGTDVDHVGFGYSDLGKTESGVKLQAVLPIGSMGCGLPGCPGGQPTNTQFSYNQTGSGLGPCNGDSGGPQFIIRGGTTYTAGITSYGDNDCNQYGASTTVSAFDGWINDFIGVAPPPPEPEICDDGVDNDGDGDTDCADSDCTSDPACAAPDPEVCDDGMDNDGDGDTDCADSDCSGDPSCAPGGLNELFSDDFESGWGNWNDGGSDVRRSSSDSAYANSGIYCVRLRDNSGSASATTSDPFDLGGYSELQIEFSFYARSMENGEDFFVELWDGSSWQVMANAARGTDFNNNTRYDATVTASSSDFNFTNNARLRIRNDASGNSDWVYVDDIVVSAQ